MTKIRKLLLFISILLSLINHASANQPTIQNPYAPQKLCTVRMEYSYPWIASVMAMCMDCGYGDEIVIEHAMQVLRRGYKGKELNIDTIDIFHDGCMSLTTQHMGE